MHSALGPSGAHRWLHCPASVRLSEGIPENRESRAAREGTLAHEIAASVLRGEPVGGQVYNDCYREGFDSGEMLQCAYEYADYVAELAPDSGLLLVESFVETGIKGVWGTADAIVMRGAHLDVIDYKYGSGLFVDPVGNPQLMLYALGALVTYEVLAEADIETVTLHVYQPRLGLTAARDWSISVEDLLGWAVAVVEPAVAHALSDDPPFGPSAEACQFCPVSGRCAAQLSMISERDFSEDPSLLAGDALADALELVPLIKHWLAAVERVALHEAMDGEVPGWKVVRSGGRSALTNTAEATDLLIRHDVPAEDFLAAPEPRFKPLSALEKVFVRGVNVREFLTSEGFISKTPGKLSLAPADDPREAVDSSSAADHFEDLPE